MQEGKQWTKETAVLVIVLWVDSGVFVFLCLCLCEQARFRGPLNTLDGIQASGKGLKTCLNSFIALGDKVNLESNPGWSHSFVEKLNHDVGMDVFDLEAIEGIAKNRVIVCEDRMKEVAISQHEFLDMITIEDGFHLLKLIKRQTVSVNALLTTVAMDSGLVLLVRDLTVVPNTHIRGNW